ncbi:MAG: type II secretion system protein GspJ [Candidatus Omnitrophota bacterium]
MWRDKGFTPLKRKRYARCKYRFLSGFTLVELLIVSGIIGVVSFAIYSTFNSGIKVWQKLSVPAPEEDAVLFLQKLSSDIGSLLFSSRINFIGTSQSVSFGGLVVLPSEEGEKKTLGRITYYWDSQEKTLNRREENYSFLYQEKSGEPRKLVNDITDIAFSYFYYDKEQKRWLPKADWSEKEKLPLAVEAKIELKNSCVLTKTIPVPISFIYPIHNTK